MADRPHDPNDTHLRPEGQKALKPRDAATLVLWRKSARGVEVVMGERHGKHAFMPNRWVFPGGRVDPTDARVRGASDLKQHVGGHLTKAASPARARALAAAAIRETFEETGLILGRPDPEPGRSVPRNWKGFFDTGSRRSTSLPVLLRRPIARAASMRASSWPTRTDWRTR